MRQRELRTSGATRLIRPLLAVIAAAGMLTMGLANAQERGATTPEQSRMINEQLSKAWADNKLTKAKPATDDEFIRRVFIDVIGRIPMAEEIKEFERDKSTNKRAKLVQRLLHSEAHKPLDPAGKPMKGDDGKPLVFEYVSEYAEHWAHIWTIWTMTRGGTHEVYHNQMKNWFEKQFANNTRYDEIVRKLLTATGKSNEKGEVNFIMAHLGDANPADRRISDGPFDAVPITSRVTRLFLGVQTQCTQCHDHPFNPEWGQENFWGVNAFFRQTERDRMPAPQAGTGKKKAPDALPVEITDNSKLNDSARIYYERRTGVLMSIKPVFLPNLADLAKDKGERAKKPYPMNGSKSRREVLADYVITHDNFSKAFVNRMWGHFFGRGMNEQPAVDDFGGHNKDIHPELIENLGKEFVKYQYNPKDLIAWICNSEAYNLSYVSPNKDMSKPEYDVYFAKMPLKAQSPEVLFESLSTATKADMQVDKDTRKANRELWMSKLVRNFGDDEGNEITFNGTIVQALLMMNGKELNDEIRRADGLVAKLMNKYKNNDKTIIEEIYLTALGRRPSATTIIEVPDPNPKKKGTTKMSELAFVNHQLGIAKNRSAGKGEKSSVQSFYEDLFWSLLNTNEFMLNH